MAAPTAGGGAVRRRSWWRIPLYPVAIPVVFCFLIWARAGVHPFWLLRPLALVAVVVIGLTLLASAITRDANTGALAAWAVTTGLVVDDLRGTLLLALVAGLVLAIGVVSRGTPWRRGPIVTRALSAFGLGLVVVVLSGAVLSGSLQGAVEDVVADLERPRVTATAAADLPDIYLLMLDAYPGAAAARMAPGFDADEFPAALRQRGFEVQARSRSNYLLTQLTLGSMFTDAHVRELLGDEGVALDSAGLSRRLRLLTDDGVVFHTLAAAGYATLSVNSGASHIGMRRFDQVLDPPGPSELELAFLRTTGLGQLLDRIDSDLLSKLERQRLVGSLDLGGQAASLTFDRPRFVFVHVPGPHVPLVFDAAGRPATDSPDSRFSSYEDPLRLDRAERIRRTYDYATYIGTLALQAIDEIQAASARPPVIVVFSDHGPDIGFVGTDPAASDLDERTSNFLAAATPGRPGLLAPGTTPINIFPQLLNAYLGTSLPSQPDTLWAWRTDSSIVDLVEIDRSTLRLLAD